MFQIRSSVRPARAADEFANGDRGISQKGIEAVTLCRFIEQAVARAYGIKPSELKAPTRRGADVAFARQVAMYLSHVSYGLTLTEVGKLFGRDRTTAAHACRLVEDRRDDPDFDALLDYLQSALDLWLKARQLVKAA